MIQKWQQRLAAGFRRSLGRNDGDQGVADAASGGADEVAVGCPFCMTMLNDASKADGGEVAVKDVAEIVAERLKLK